MKKVITRPFVMPEDLETQACFGGWLLSQMFPLKMAHQLTVLVHAKQKFCVQLFLLTQEGNLVHLSQSALLRVKCRGNSMNIRELGLKQCVQRLI